MASAIELAVGLGARPAHGRTLGAIEHPELDAGRVGDPAHQPVERIDLAHEMAFAEAANGRIARHRADGRKARCVSSAVRAPMRAAAAAASQPAWPPPTTMTSKLSRSHGLDPPDVSRETYDLLSRCRNGRISHPEPVRHRSAPIIASKRSGSPHLNLSATSSNGLPASAPPRFKISRGAHGVRDGARG